MIVTTATRPGARRPGSTPVRTACLGQRSGSPPAVRVPGQADRPVRPRGSRMHGRLVSEAARAVALVAAAITGAAGSAAEPPAGNLLARPDVTIAPADPTHRIAAIAELTDGDAATAIELPARGGSEVDVVISWGGAAVGLRRLVVGLDPKRPAVQPTDLEILVSADAAGERFSVVKSIDLFGGAGPYQYDFGPVTAQRVIVRLRAPTTGSGVRITELALVAADEQPAHRPPTGAHSPAQALALLASLRQTPLDQALPAAEEAMLTDGADGRFDEGSFAAAALIASGVADAAALTGQLAVIDRLVAEAHAAVAGERDLAATGEKLLRLLHAGCFRGGYELHQTDVSTVLQTGRFNCVSSAVVYTIVGRRLGLDVRGIAVPEHAFAILYDGARHYDVETTIPEGFHPARSPEAVEKFRARTGFVYVPESHREARREVNDAGLVALIYYNHGVTLADRGDHPAALAMYFRGLRLDPNSVPLAKNALAAWANWAKAELDARRFAAAREILLTGARLNPTDDTLADNLEYAIQEELAAADPETEPARLATAVSLVTSLPRTSDVPDVIARHLHRRTSAMQQAGHWAEAEAYVRRHAAALAPLGDRALEESVWEQVYLPWAEAADDDWDAVIDRCRRGLQAAPRSRLIHDTLERGLDMRARRHFDTDWPAAIRAYEAALEILPRSSLLENNLRFSRQQAENR